jgi:hypothetical protein
LFELAPTRENPVVVLYIARTYVKCLVSFLPEFQNSIGSFEVGSFRQAKVEVEAVLLNS